MDDANVAAGRVGVPRHGVTAHPMAAPAKGAPSGGRRGLSGWPIRRKLVALVTVPLLVILAACAFLTWQTIRGWQQAQNAERIASAAADSNVVAEKLQTELSTTLALIKTPTQSTATRLSRDRAATDKALTDLGKALASPPGGGWDVGTRARIDALETAWRTGLPQVRQQVFPKGLDPSLFGDSPQQPGLQPKDLQPAYVDVIDTPRLLTAQLARPLAKATPDGGLVNTSTGLDALATASYLAADEIVNINTALTNGQALPGRQDISGLATRQLDLLTLAKDHLTSDQRVKINAITADDQLTSFRTAATDFLENGQGSQTAQARAAAQAAQFVTLAGQRLEKLDDLVDTVAGQARDTATTKAHDLLIRVGTIGGGALLVLLLLTAFTVAVARSVTVPLRRLRTAAVETANVRLPAAVQQIGREGPDAHVVMPPALPPGRGGGPETSEVARAVDGLTAEAVRLASAQVALRRSLDDAFVSMSRRSQSMVEKQLAIIDELERTEEDPEQLRNLFRLDHLAARMRRYNDNLLVLAGSVVRTRSNAPVPIADVFRAATSEMEQYERVRLQPVSGAAIAGPAAGGLIHLLAELLDNAAMYSPPTSPILMAAASTEEGGLRLEITDSGVGIPASELAELNTRLASPGAFDMQVPSRMGLYVVARLAQRGGFSVQLAQRAGAAGTVAEVMVPPALVIGSSALAAEPARTPTPVPGIDLSPARGLRLPAAGAPSEAGAAVAPLPTRPPRAIPGGRPGPLAPAAEGAQTPAAGTPTSPRLDREGWEPSGPLAPAASGSSPSGALEGLAAGRELVDDDATTRLPRPGRGDVEPEAAEARAAGSGSDGEGETDESLTTPLPSRHPGAVLAGGPLGGPVPPSGPSPFGASALAPDAEAVATQNGGGGSGAAGGGFGMPGRPFTAGTPSPGRRTGAGGPSAATAAAAAAAARAARSGGSGPTPASALFAARGPATEATGSGVSRAFDAGSSRDGVDPNAPTPPSGVAAEPLSTTGLVPGRSESSAAPAAWQHGPAVEAARGRGATPGPVSEPEEAEPTATTASLAEAWSYEPSGAHGSPTGPSDVPADVLSERASQTSAGQTSSEHAGAAADQPVADAEGEPTAAAADQHRRDTEPAMASRRDAGMPEAFSPDVAVPQDSVDTPIFDTISTWFSSDYSAGEPDRVIDLRDRPEGTRVRASAQRWSSLGDQRWLATNARAAAAPEVAGTTDVGLPRRRPGANLIPSAAAAAPIAAPGRVETARRGSGPGPFAGRSEPGGRVDADGVRGRLSSYQRGLTSARRARHLTAERSDSGLFASPRDGENDPGQSPGEQGG
jgi:signal transduction histidine kinase